MNKIKAFLYLALTAFLITATWGVTVVVRRVDGVLTEVESTAREIRVTATNISGYTTVQVEALKNPKNQKALEAGLQTLAVYNGTGRLINTQVLPRAMRVLDDLSGATVALNALVSHSDEALNQKLMPELVATAKALNTSVESVDRAVQDLSRRGALSLDDIHAIMADPSWKQALSAVAQASRHVEGVTGNLEDASAQMPSIAASLERIAKTSSKYQKALILVQVLSTLARAFL